MSTEISLDMYEDIELTADRDLDGQMHLFVEDTEEGASASLSLAYHECVLTRKDGSEIELSTYKQNQINEWFDEQEEWIARAEEEMTAEPMKM